MGILDQWKKKREKKKKIGKQADKEAQKTYWKEFKKERVSQARQRARQRARQDAKPRDFKLNAKKLGDWFGRREINPKWLEMMGMKDEKRSKKK